MLKKHLAKVAQIEATSKDNGRAAAKRSAQFTLICDMLIRRYGIAMYITTKKITLNLK